MSNVETPSRVEVLNSYKLLDTETKKDFDDLVQLASIHFGVPISTISLLDDTRQWFKASVGLTICETPRKISFCHKVLEDGGVVIVEDALSDDRFYDNPLVTGNPHIRSYLGFPIKNSNGYILGTFCIIDIKPRAFSKMDVSILEKFANQAMRLMELHKELIEKEKLTIEISNAYGQVLQIQQIWMLAMDAAGDGVWDCNIKNGESYFGPNWVSMLGYHINDIEGSYEAFKKLIHPDDLIRFEQNAQNYLEGKIDKYQIEIRVKCKDGSYKWVLSRGMIVERDEQNEPLRIVGTHTDINHYKHLEETIWKQANYDLLTGLPNRRLFLNLLQQEIKRCKRHDQLFALFFIDLDGFKDINDNYGHNVGDKLLVLFSKRVSKIIRETDVFARLAGDEFNILQTNIVSKLDTIVLADKIIKQLSRKFLIGKYQIHLSASIGISVFPENGENVDELLKLSDTAMYAAKSNGKNCWMISQYSN